MEGWMNKRLGVVAVAAILLSACSTTPRAEYGQPLTPRAQQFKTKLAGHIDNCSMQKIRAKGLDGHQALKQCLCEVDVWALNSSDEEKVALELIAQRGSNAVDPDVKELGTSTVRRLSGERHRVCGA